MKLGNLALVMERAEESLLPQVVIPKASPEINKMEMEMLDEMAKNYPAQEKAMLQQIKELRTNSILDAKNWEELLSAVKAVRNKSDA